MDIILSQQDMLQFLIVLALGAIGAVLFLRWQSERQQQQRLEGAFYQLIQAKGGSMSLIQLATMAKVDAALAKTYFDRQVKVLNAIPEVDDDGDMTYRFPKLDLPPVLPRDDWGDAGDDWS
jgi:hypothetical protein